MEAVADTPGDVPFEKSVLRDYFETIVVCVIFVLFARAFVFQQSKIPTGSMKNTLLEGDYIMVNKLAYTSTPLDWERSIMPSRDVQRGDVVVFKFPQQPEQDYIKRVIGLPGETIEMRQGVVYVDGVALDEPYVIHSAHDYPNQRPPHPRFDNHPPRRVPEGQYWVLGDNRDSSQDSRYWGFVPFDHIKGRAFLIWWSILERDGEYQERNPAKRMRNMGRKLVTLPWITRWGRQFTIIR